MAESEEAAELASKRVKVNTEDSDGDLGERPGSKQQKKEKDKEKHSLDVGKIPVNEDYLFDVDIRKRELAPVYWLGPAYDVRRGTWFYQGNFGLQTPNPMKLKTSSHTNIKRAVLYDHVTRTWLLNSRMVF